MTELDPVVIWHDVECGTYTADLALWRELASEAPGAVLDVGAGTGRVALDLAAAGFEVVALDREPVLLAALSRRAGDRGLDVATVCADAAGFALDRDFGLVLVPMQTIQLLPDAGARSGFWASARRHLRAAGRVAVALAPGIEPFEPALVRLPDPDVGEHDGRRYESQPVAVRRSGDFLELERRRYTVAVGGARTSERDVIRLAEVDSALIEREGARAGLEPEPRRHVPETDRHVASEVVVLHA